ncbi:MAG TPA: hypothetical protein VF060_34255 [Trebonia sp.]
MMITTSLKLAAIAGAATGLRSTVAVAALVNAGAPGLPHQLTGQAARIGALLGVAGELVADKLPSTPSRLGPSGLGGRLALAATAGAVLARGGKDPVLPAVVVAAAAALASAKIGHDVRTAAAKRVPPLAAAAAEDTVALGLAAASTRT